MAAAELAAWRSGTWMPAASRAATAASKRSSCSAVNGSSGSSATAQWVHSAVERQVRLGVHHLGQADDVLGGGADAVHPGVDLEVHGHGQRRRGPPSPGGG